jgi:hypothetical protein
LTQASKPVRYSLLDLVVFVAAIVLLIPLLMKLLEIVIETIKVC